MKGTGSVFTPPSIKQWMETDQLVGFANNDPVASWANTGTGGTNYDLIQSTLSKKPSYKTGGPNGKRYLAFNNASFQTMRTSSTTVLNDNVGTIVMVLSPVNQSGTFQAGYIGRKFGLYYLINGVTHNWGVFLGTSLISSLALTIGTYYVLGLVVRATNDVDLYTGLSKVTRTTGTSYDAKGAAFVGSNNDVEQFGGLNVVAVGYDDSALSTTAMNNLISALGTKYAISV